MMLRRRRHIGSYMSNHGSKIDTFWESVDSIDTWAGMGRLPDAAPTGRMTGALVRESEKVARIARTYYAWRGEQDAGAHENVPGFCKSAALEEIRTHGHVLTPGRYVGAETQEDDGEPFAEKMKRLTAGLREQMAEARKLDAAIGANLICR
jgi:type I restriction enzyme M protein